MTPNETKQTEGGSNTDSSPSACSTHKGERYKLYEGSQSAHCCFAYTIQDTTKPDIINGEHYKGSDGQYHYESVCECFEKEDAELILKALNSL